MLLLVCPEVGELDISMCRVSVRERIKDVGKRFGNDVRRF